MTNDELLRILNTSQPRAEMRFRRARRLDTNHDSYTVDDLVKMFGPYIQGHCMDGLSPREVRLLETVFALMGQAESWRPQPDSLA